jgi:cytochrome c peroxidase
LGRYLFFDPLLSKNGNLACASCHQPDKGFSDGLPRSIGADGKEIQRNAPSLWNTGLQHRLFWDGRASTFEQQMLGPLYDPKEMANTPANLLKSLNASPEYRRLFATAFANNGKEIQLEQVYTALAAFQSSLISLNSRYDLYAGGFHDALTTNEIEGMNVFRSFVARCAECHTPPLFSNQQVAVIGMPQPKGRPFDVGAQAISGESTQRGGFKVPSLRNVTKTAPYSHSGRFSTLHETVEFYTLGRGHAVPKNEKLTLHWHIWEPKLSSNEINRLVDFLGALTDESFKPAVPHKVPSGLKPMPLPAVGNPNKPLTKETP